MAEVWRSPATTARRSLWDVACRRRRIVDETAVFRHRADRDLRAGFSDSTPNADDAANRISPDGRFIIKIGKDNTARVYDVHSGAAAAPPLVHRGAILYAAFSPDGLRIVTTSTDQTARVWDAAQLALRSVCR